MYLSILQTSLGLVAVDSAGSSADRTATGEGGQGMEKCTHMEKWSSWDKNRFSRFGIKMKTHSCIRNLVLISP